VSRRPPAKDTAARKAYPAPARVTLQADPRSNGQGQQLTDAKTVGIESSILALRVFVPILEKVSV
jgi:hypothetical protein